MNIGIVTSWFERGAAYLSRSFMYGLQRLGHNVFIFVRGGEIYDYGPDWNLSNVYYSSSKMGACSRCRYTGISDIDEFNQWLDSHNIEIAMFNEQLDPLPMVECKSKGIKTVFFGLAYVMPIDYYSSHFDLVVCHTKLTYKIFEPTGIAHLVPWGVDTESFTPQGANLTDDRVIFFHNVGMSFENLRKGTDSLIKAWSRLTKAEKKMARLIIHSQLDVDVLYRQVSGIREIVEREKNIEFFIGTSKPPSGYHLANIYVYPARVDSLGLTITEAMACGMPVITTSAEPFNEFVVHDYNGLLVRARRRSWSNTLGDTNNWGYYDVTLTDLTHKLRYFIKHPHKIVEMGKNSRRLTEEQFDFWKNFLRIDSLIHNLLQQL